MSHQLRAAAQFIWLFLVQLPVIALGVFLVPIGIPFRRNVNGVVRLPKWLLPWDNILDGITGDSRGYYQAYSKDWPPFLAMWWWTAFRNPANYFKRFIIACDITKTRTTKLAGQSYVRDDLYSTGWQFLVAVDGFEYKNYYQLYVVKRWFNSSRALVIQLGFKFKLDDELIDYSDSEYKKFKGFTFEIAPFKFIG